VFSGTSAVHGVGHASFTTSPDGAEDWIVYHSKRTTTPGWDRDIRLQRFTWLVAGDPLFGEPIPSGTPSRDLLANVGGELRTPRETTAMQPRTIHIATTQGSKEQLHKYLFI
jgi:hypothetical protein